MTETYQTNLEKFMTIEHIQGILNSINKNALSTESLSQPLKKQINFPCHKEKQQSDCMEGYQFKEYFIYVFAKNYENQSKITLYSFQKEDGSQTKTIFKEFKNRISCMKIVLQFQKPINQIKKGEDPQTSFKILMGTDDGFLKILDLSPPYSVNHVKIDIKPIKMIISGDYTSFDNQNICILLSNDNFIYFIDLQKLEIAYVMKPMIIMCDYGLSISLNQQQTHLMQCTSSGYIILWRMNRIYDFFKERKNKKNHQEKPLRNYDVFASFIDHSIAIQGLIWCQFYGHLIILITKSGILKIVGLIFGNENEFVELLNFKIQNADSITHVKFFQQLDMILISKNIEQKHLIQKIHLDHQLQVAMRIIINIEKIDFIHDFYINKQFDILLCRGTKCFVLNKCNELEEPGSFDGHMEKQKQY